MRRWYGLALAALLGVVLSGCGGGGGGAAAPLATMTLTLRTLNGATPTSAAWVAYQDGEGVWKTLAPKSAGVYTAKLTAADGRYGLAIAAPAGTQPAMTVYQGTLAEMATVTHLLSPFSPGTFTLGGQFLGAVPGTDTATVALGLNTAMSPQLAPYQLAFLPAGTCDVAAVRRKLAPPHIDKIFLRRALSLKGNATLDIDFSDAAQAFTPQAFTLTCPGMT
ncbi:MAG TPA: hypothetical protein PLZ36_05840, partial [Armatimonadota bacterium]|nr:hypothetical protein [Armatimonadota bacterium]